MWKLFKRRQPTKRVTGLYAHHKEAARACILDRLTQYADQYGFVFKRVAIRDTRRSWGSCSSKGNLNFSYKLLFLPACFRDYIIVHELCHLRVLNHSQAFWDEVVAIMPDALERAKALRHFEKTHGTAVSTLQRWSAEHRCSVCTVTYENTREISTL